MVQCNTGHPLLALLDKYSCSGGGVSNLVNPNDSFKDYDRTQ